MLHDYSDGTDRFEATFSDEAHSPSQTRTTHPRRNPHPRKSRPHLHLYTERDLRDLFHISGMRIVHLEKFYKSPSGTIARVSKNGFFMHVRKD